MKNDEIAKYRTATFKLLEEKNRLEFQVNCLKVSNNELIKNTENIIDKQRLYKQNHEQDKMNELVEIKKHEKKCENLLAKYNSEMKLREAILQKESVIFILFCYVL